MEMDKETFDDADEMISRSTTQDGARVNGNDVYKTTEVLFDNDEGEDAAKKSDQTARKEVNGDASKSPSLPTSPPPEDAPSGTFNAKRKLFGWLSRPSSVDSGLKSPPPQSRRGTLTSIFSTESIPEARPKSKHGSENAEDTEAVARRIHRNSLKDRFKFVRMREEAGIVTLDDQEGSVTSGLQSRPQSTQDASTPVMADNETAQEFKLRRQSSTSGPMSPVMQPTVSDDLPPGSAAGTFSGPTTTNDQAVDWDLWQEVVYEGPAAVARTSSDELSLAIKRGIPSAIRGVVWQVLAQSKNEDLEDVYKDLVARGTTNERRPSDLSLRPSALSRNSSTSRPGSDILSPPLVTPTEIEPVMAEEQNTAVPAEKEDHLISENDLPDVTPSQSATVSEGQPTSQKESTQFNGTALLSPTISKDIQDLDGTSKSQIDSSAQEQKRHKDDLIALQKLERAIRRDLGTRTSFSKFLMSAGLQEGLFGVCKAYALFDEEVGYAQGMNFIAMPLLFNMPEEEAFCLFVRLMNQYRLRDLFIHDMSGLHLHLYQFERLLEDFEPALYCHLHRRGVQPQLYATQWFLTLFAYRFPLQLVLRIYDLILSEGLESAILKFGVVLMQKNTKKLLEMRDMSALTTFLKDRIFDVYIDKSPSASSLLESGFFGSAGGIDKEVYRADALVEDACAVPITPEMLKLYTKEWEEKVQDEKAKIAELDNLRTQNTQLTVQLRQMSQNTETLDKEHVSLASDLVKTKISNQNLADENESLTHRITELQAIIDAQPGEVEERLRAEMERIMTRNAEVQHENRALEEQCTEMEGELANAKMKVAEMDSELENMRNRWRSMEGLMSGMAKSPSIG